MAKLDLRIDDNLDGAAQLKATEFRALSEGSPTVTQKNWRSCKGLNAMMRCLAEYVRTGKFEFEGEDAVNLLEVHGNIKNTNSKQYWPWLIFAKDSEIRDSYLRGRGSPTAADSNHDGFTPTVRALIETCAFRQIFLKKGKDRFEIDQKELPRSNVRFFHEESKSPCSPACLERHFVSRSNGKHAPTSRPQAKRLAKPQPPKHWHEVRLSQGKKLFGREAEFDEILRFAFGQSARPLLVISGDSGNGKSSLVDDFVNRTHFSWDAVLTWRFYQDDSFENFIISALEHLSGLPREELKTLDGGARTALLIDYLRINRILLVLDGLEAVSQGKAQKTIAFDQYTANMPVEFWLKEFVNSKSLSRTIVTTTINSSSNWGLTDIPTDLVTALDLSHVTEEAAAGIWQATSGQTVIKRMREKLSKAFKTLRFNATLIEVLAGSFSPPFEKWWLRQKQCLQAPSGREWLSQVIDALANPSKQVLQCMSAFSCLCDVEVLKRLVSKVFKYTDTQIDGAICDLTGRRFINPVSLSRNESNRLYYCMHQLVSNTAWNLVGKLESQFRFGEKLFVALADLHDRESALRVFLERLNTEESLRQFPADRIQLLKRMFDSTTPHRSGILVQDQDSQALIFALLAGSFHMNKQPALAKEYLGHQIRVRGKMGYHSHMAKAVCYYAYTLYLGGQLQEAVEKLHFLELLLKNVQGTNVERFLRDFSSVLLHRVEGLRKGGSMYSIVLQQPITTESGSSDGVYVIQPELELAKAIQSAAVLIDKKDFDTAAVLLENCIAQSEHGYRLLRADAYLLRAHIALAKNEKELARQMANEAYLSAARGVFPYEASKKAAVELLQTRLGCPVPPVICDSVPDESEFEDTSGA